MRRILFAGALGLLCAVGAPSLERLALFSLSPDRAAAETRVAANEGRRANARPGRAPRTQAERRAEHRRAERMLEDAKRAERAERQRIERRHENRKKAEKRAERKRSAGKQTGARAERKGPDLRKTENRPGRHGAERRRQAEKQAERPRTERPRAERRWERENHRPRGERNRHDGRARADRHDRRHVGRPHGWRPARWRGRDWRPRRHYRAPYWRAPHPRWGRYYYSPFWDWYFVAPLATATLVYVATLPADRPCEGYDFEGERLYACDGVLYRPTSYQREVVYEIVSSEDDFAAPPPPARRLPPPPAPRELRLASPMMTGPAVRALQTELAELGVMGGGEVDGVFGRKTDRALRVFQREWGVPATGILDEETAALLGL